MEKKVMDLNGHISFDHVHHMMIVMCWNGILLPFSNGILLPFSLFEKG